MLQELLKALSLSFHTPHCALRTSSPALEVQAYYETIRILFLPSFLWCYAFNWRSTHNTPEMAA
jgi:hypothetical protein